MSERRGKPKPGLEVGDYVLVRRAQSHSDFEVWEGRHKEASDRRAALVLYRREPRLLVKPAALLALDHPAVVGSHEARPHQDGFLLRRDWVEGEPLSLRLARSKPPEPWEIRDILADVLGALEYAHGKGILHPALSPSHILLDREGKAKVWGFGVVPGDGSVEPAGAAGDLQAIGAVLYEMFSGAPLMEGEPVALKEAEVPWNAFFARLRGVGAPPFASASEALEALGQIPAARPALRRVPSWIAGPFFVVGIFLVSYVGLGMAYLAPPLRLLGGLAGLGLALGGAWGIAQPWATALFWGGAFWAYAVRAFPFYVPLGGLAVSLAGAAVYLQGRRAASRRW